MAMTPKADADELRKAVRMALPHLRRFREGLVESYATKRGDVTSISKRERVVIAEVASLDRAIRKGEKVLTLHTLPARAAKRQKVDKPRTTNRKEPK
jgi:hypothetical protein